MRPQREAAFEDFCRPRLIFCEVLRQRKTYFPRTTKLVLVFPCYAFVRANSFDLATIRDYEHVHAVLGVPEQRRFEMELGFVKELIASGRDIYCGKLKRGDPVEVRSGPFRGMRGYFCTVKGGEQRVEIELTTLGRSIAVEVSAEEIEHAA